MKNNANQHDINLSGSSTISWNFLFVILIELFKPFSEVVAFVVAEGSKMEGKKES